MWFGRDCKVVFGVIEAWLDVGTTVGYHVKGVWFGDVMVGGFNMVEQPI